MSHGGGESNTKSEPTSATSSTRAGADHFGRAVAKIAVAQICESVGFEGFKDSALDAFADFVIRFIRDLGKSSSFHANLAGRTQCNLFDTICGLEELGAVNGFLGASEIRKCLVGSGMVREIIQFSESNEEVPFAQPIPQFPIIRNRRLIPSFEEVNETPPGKHIPSWLPAFPDRHTYVYTPMWNERKSDPRADKIEQARQRRKAEMALLSLQQRLVSNVEAGSSSSWKPNYEVNDSQEAGSNPYLAKPLQSEEKDVPPVVLPAKLRNELSGGNTVSVMDAFGPAIEAVKGSSLCDDGDGDRKNLPDKRPAVNFKFRSGKKFLGEFLDTSLQKKGGGRSASLWRDDEKDDKKRRAEYILRQSIENPQELTQL
ncbi:transcription initiation factor TFIID subunit 8-like [Mangifera indica]|uniref:transcription initiation factor TFIID subunit 8-like n=1 Tax=Mangifera indica TaxID=29780 RepID=UPI001CF9E1B5|nr:transcription initiation factor TFIID subunit 8-like [Mangifera indica]